MSLDVFKKAAEGVALLQADNSALKAQVKSLNEQLATMQSEVNAAKKDTQKAVDTGKAEAVKLSATVLERGNQLQDARNTIEALRAELGELKVAYKELSEKS